MNIKSRVVIWGTGYYYRNICNHLNKLKQLFADFSYEIEALIDSNKDKQGTIIDGRKVYSPSYLDDIDKNILVIVALRNVDEIIPILNKKGITYYQTAEDILSKENILVDCIDNNLEVDRKNSPIYYRGKVRSWYRNNKNEYINNSSIPYIYKLSALMGECGEEIVNVEIDENLKDKIKNNKTKIGIYYGRLFNGGVERVISQLIPLYLLAGYEVVLFTNVKTEDDYTIPSEVQRCIIPFDSWFPYEWLEKFYNELKERKITVLINHAHATTRAYFLGKCAKELGIKYVVESHTCIAAIKNKIKLYYRNYSIADRLVVLSEMDQEYWDKQKINTLYIPNPVSLTCFSSDDKYNDNEILWLGRIDVVEKNVYEIVPIAKKIKEKIPDAVINIVGRADDPQILEELKNKIRDNGLTENINLCGYSNEVGKYYKSAAVYFMTSPYEGFPMSLIESKNYGLPTVMYDIEGLELTKDNLGVIKIPQGNVEALANGIISILENKEKRKKLSIEARQSIEKFADIDLMNLWKKVIEA